MSSIVRHLQTRLPSLSSSISLTISPTILSTQASLFSFPFTKLSYLMFILHRIHYPSSHTLHRLLSISFLITFPFKLPTINTISWSYLSSISLPLLIFYVTRTRKILIGIRRPRITFVLLFFFPLTTSSKLRHITFFPLYFIYPITSFQLLLIISSSHKAHLQI